MTERYITFRRVMFARETILIITLAIFSLIASILSPYFFNIDNFRAIIIAISLDTIIVIGMTIVLVGGGIDLSVGSTIGFSAIVVASTLAAGINIPTSIIIGLSSGAIIGAMNGALISYVGIDPLIATLGMMTAVRSGVYVVAGGQSLARIPVRFKAFARGDVLGIPNLFIIGLLSIVLFDFLLRKNSVFRKYYFVGGNEKTAYLAGIKVKAFKFFSYIITGLGAAIAGILLVSRMGSAFPHSGMGTELRIISACIIGGCGLAGGKGKVLGSFLGVILLALVSNVLVLLGVRVEWQGVASGAILILAVLADAIIQRREQR